MIPGAGDAARQWSRMGNRKHSVLPEPVPVAMTVERPAAVAGSVPIAVMVERPGAAAGSVPIVVVVERPGAGEKPVPAAPAVERRPAPAAAPASVPVVIERPAVVELRPALAARREKAMRWCRYGVNPSGISGKGSPPSGAGWKGRAMERYGPLGEVPGLGQKVVHGVRERRVGRPEAGGEEVAERAGDLGGDDGGDHGAGRRASAGRGTIRRWPASGVRMLGVALKASVRRACFRSVPASAAVEASPRLQGSGAR